MKWLVFFFLMQLLVWAGSVSCSCGKCGRGSRFFVKGEHLWGGFVSGDKSLEMEMLACPRKV